MSADNRGDLKLLALVLGVAALMVVALAVVLVPFGGEVVTVLNAGMGLKAAAVWGLGVTVVLLVVFALVAGDGLLGELQFMLGSFFVFFVVLTLLIAWVF